MKEEKKRRRRGRGKEKKETSNRREGVEEEKRGPRGRGSDAKGAGDEAIEKGGVCINKYMVKVPRATSNVSKGSHPSRESYNTIDRNEIKASFLKRLLRVASSRGFNGWAGCLFSLLMAFFLFFCWCLFVCLSDLLSVSVWSSVCPSDLLSVCLFDLLSVCLFGLLSVCQFDLLSVCL